MLKFLYETFAGRIILKLLSARWLSILAGKWLDRPSSKFLIKPFLKKGNIDLSEYQKEDYKCFNDCFTRHIKPENRPVDTRKDALIAPCDGLLRAYKIDDDLVMPVKESIYSIKDLLKKDECAKCFEGGTALVFRLCVDHYHRYCFPDNGRVTDDYFIEGVLHTVQPIALRNRPVFVENCRNIALLETENFGRIAQIEVGAMLVGKIKNHKITEFEKGMEKGMFLYGGSTIILLLEKDKVRVPQSCFKVTDNGTELKVKQGQRIGKAI